VVLKVPIGIVALLNMFGDQAAFLAGKKTRVDHEFPESSPFL
jgi:hypothetical protein